MNTNRIIGTYNRRFLSVLLSSLLLLHGAALADGKDGKKDFKEGQKYGQQQQWDMAAQKFALALAAEPNNAEYKIHYLQALQRASLMYVARGDALADQNDYSGAYAAYRQAYNYDAGNEIAKFKMGRMLGLQMAQASGTGDQIKYNAKTGNVTPVSREIQVANDPRPRNDVQMDLNLTNVPLKHTIRSLTEPLDLNVAFDDAVQDSLRVTVKLKNVTPSKALDIILMQKRLAFEQVDRRTIFIYSDANPVDRQRFEKLLVKTFYLNNISAQQARNALAQILPPGRQAAVLDSAGGTGASGNVLVVRATQAELQLVQDVLASIDKNKNEVVLDIEIYEVSKDSMVQIGNQIVASPVDVTRTLFGNDGKPVGAVTTKSPSLSNLGGIGLGRLNGGDASIGGNLFAPFLGGIGTLFGLPPTQLSFLQSKGKSKLLHKTQIHVLDGQENETKIGRKVPVRIGFQYPAFGGGINSGGLAGLNNNNNNGGVAQNIANGVAAGLGLLNGVAGFSAGFDSIQYQDVGLAIKARPTITNEGHVEIKMNFESSDVISSGVDALNLTPTFVQRTLSTVARIQDGVTAVVAGVNQDVRGDSRAGVPVLGMLPLVGRLFATPRQESRQTDVIITVTPHIIRSAGVTAEDHLAHIGPPQMGGMRQSIEDVINRAQAEEEQERRLIAERQGAGAPNPGGSAPVSQPASFDNQRPEGGSQPAGFNGQQPSGAFPQSAVQPVGNPGNRKTTCAFALGSATPAGAPPAVPEKQ
jgi:general secretion pathway protein D